MAEGLDWDVSLPHQCQPVVGKRSIFLRQNDVLTVFDVLCCSAGHDCRYVFQFVTGTQIRSVTDDSVIEQAATIDIFGFLESIEEVSKQHGAFLIALAGCDNPWLRKSIVTQRMRFQSHAHPG